MKIIGSLLAGFIATTIWFGFEIAFDADKSTSLIGAPICFAIAFGIGAVVHRVAGNKTATQ